MSETFTPLYFSVSQKQCVTTIEDISNGEMFKEFIHTTEPLYILHYQAVFEELWNIGIDAQERMSTDRKQALL